MARYAGRLRDPALSGVLRGYLTGSLDLVFRCRDGRFVLADYKTNRLAAPDESLTAWHYRPDAMQAEMEAAHYPLQALLYSVALHRYLRWRLPGYEPERHLGGVLYLFVRGMSALGARPASDGSALRCVVLAATGALVESLSDLFDRGLTRDRRARASDAFDGAQALRAPAGCCATFNRAGVLSTSDVHVALRLARLSGTDGRAVVRSGAAFAARAPRLGHVCVDLADIKRHRERGHRHARRPRRAALARPGRLAQGRWPEPARRGATARSTWRGRTSTWTASGRTSARWPPT